MSASHKKRKKRKTHTAGQGGDGHARVAGWSGEAARADGRSGWARTWAAERKQGDARGETGKRPLRIRTQMKGKTHTAGQGWDGHARAAERSGWARTGGWVDERGTHGWRRGEVWPHGRRGGEVWPHGRRGGEVRPHGWMGGVDGHARVAERKQEDASGETQAGCPTPVRPVPSVVGTGRRACPNGIL